MAQKDNERTPRGVVLEAEVAAAELLRQFDSGQTRTSFRMAFYRRFGYMCPNPDDHLSEVVAKVHSRLLSGDLVFGSFTHLGVYVTNALMNAFLDQRKRYYERYLSYDVPIGDNNTHKDVLAEELEVDEEEDAEERETAAKDKIERYMTFLSEDQCTALRCLMADMPYQEIADENGWKLNQTKSIIHSAKQMILRVENEGFVPMKVRERKKRKQYKRKKSD